MNASNTTPPARYGFALVAGIGLIAAGLVLSLENLGIPVPDTVFRLWPLLLVLLGLSKVAQRDGLHKGGHFLVFLGLFLQGLLFEPVQTLRYAPPLGLLWLGILVTLRALRPRSRPKADPVPVETAGHPATE